MIDLAKSHNKDKIPQRPEITGEYDDSDPIKASRYQWIYNWVEDNFHLSNKKALFWNMTRYYWAMGEDPWKALPITFHISNGEKDEEWQNFLTLYFEIWE